MGGSSSHGHSCFLCGPFSSKASSFLALNSRGERERDSGEDTLAFELPQSRSDPYCFCSLPIGYKKPLVCPSIKETRTGSLAVGWEEVWVKVSNLRHTGNVAGANSPDHCEYWTLAETTAPTFWVKQVLTSWVHTDFFVTWEHVNHLLSQPYQSTGLQAQCQVLC